MPFCLAIGNEFRKALPYVDMTANKFLKSFLGFLHQSKLPSIAFFNGYPPFKIIRFDGIPSFWSETLPNEDTEVIPDNGTVKITLYDRAQLILASVNEIIDGDGGK
jgi:hypothetical protein